MAGWKDKFETGNSFFIACRNASIILFIGILLFWPSIIKSITKEAGIREIAGAKFDQEEFEKTAEAAESVTESSEKGVNLEDNISELLEKKPDGAAFTRTEIQSIFSEVQSLNSDLKKADEKVGDKLKDEQEKLVDEKVIEKKLSGWIYLGKAKPNSNTWMRNADGETDATILADRPPRKGARVTLTTDVYVRDDVESSQKRNAAPINGRATKNQKFVIEQVDNSKRLEDGGRATWARVTLAD